MESFLAEMVYLWDSRWLWCEEHKHILKRQESASIDETMDAIDERGLLTTSSENPVRSTLIP